MPAATSQEKIDHIIALSDGVRTARQIAELTSVPHSTVRKILMRIDVPRPNQGAQPGAGNHQFVCGRRIDRDGYVLVTVDQGHPYARQRPNRQGKIMFEHRHVMEQKIGRYLDPTEIVDHIDGLTLHNAPENLRIFASNGEHLRHTIQGQCPQWSEPGRENLKIACRRQPVDRRVDTYDLNKKRGDVRLRQILRAWLSLGSDSPYLLGTHRHLEKAGIDWSDRSSLERALADLSARWATGHAL